MTSERIVQRIVDYLDASCSTDAPSTLVGLHWYVDGHEKTLPLVEEVNLGLQRRPLIHVVRENGHVLFGPNGPERTIAGEDLSAADREYRKQFSAKYNALRQKA
jgi:hypothetical protein